MCVHASNQFVNQDILRSAVYNFFGSQEIKFIKNKEIQRDFLYSLPLLSNRQGVDYAIVFPNEDTFNEVIGQLEKDSGEYFSPPKFTSKGGRSLITPRIGVVKTREKHLAVCFSYLQGEFRFFCLVMFW